MTDPRWLFSRRAILGSLAVAGLSPLLKSTRANALTAAAPKRFIVVHVPEGMWGDAPRPTAAGLGPILSPLVPFASQVRVLNGLDMKSRDQGPGGDGHHRGVPHMLTGTEMLNDSQAGGASVDQRIADAISGTTRFKSLELGVRIIYGDTNSKCIWSGPGQSLSIETNPFNAYKSIFAGGTGPPTPVENVNLTLRKSALDFSLGEMDGLRAKLGGDDRQRLESYQTSLREIEKRLAALQTPPAVCQPPTQGNAVDPVAMDQYPKVLQLQTDLMISAMQCDLTRVGSLHWGNSNDQCTYPWLGINALGHDLSHNAVADPSSKKLKVYNWYAEQFAYMLGKLSMAKEGAGCMLDNTTILWASEFSDSNGHAANNLMWLLMGNVAGFFRSGSVVACNGRSVNDLHTSLCQAYGIQTSSFGNPAYCAGPLTGIHA